MTSLTVNAVFMETKYCSGYVGARTDVACLGLYVVGKTGRDGIRAMCGFPTTMLFVAVIRQCCANFSFFLVLAGSLRHCDCYFAIEMLAMITRDISAGVGPQKNEIKQKNKREKMKKNQVAKKLINLAWEGEQNDGHVLCLFGGSEPPTVLHTEKLIPASSHIKLCYIRQLPTCLAETHSYVNR